MEQENLQDVLGTDTNTLEDNSVEEKPKGEDIYVENDISKLERMLGISSTEEVDAELLEEDEENSTENQEDIPPSSGEEIEEEVVEVVKENPVLLSDFMDPSDTDSFTFLERVNDGYSLVSLDLKDKKAIQKAVRSPNYIFRYNKFSLKDPVIGFTENKLDYSTDILYKVYFPEYSLSFVVSSDYQKPYSISFKDYFEDLVSRVRPSDMKLDPYKSSITITSLKVLETGLLEVETSTGTEKYLINNRDISFYSVLDYIRTVSDQGIDNITVSLIPEFFTRI